MFKTNTYRSYTAISTLVVLLAILGAILLSAVDGLRPVASAAPSQYLNFQARLKTSTGGVVPDGNYNIEFKLYNASTSSGSSQGSCVGDTNCLWVETRTSTNRVRVANGYLTVNLGSVTNFPSNIPWGDELWLTMNIGGTNGTPSWDGEMSPRLLLTAVPHAFRADVANSALALTDGTSTFAATDFLRVAQSSVQGVNSANTAIRLNQTGAGNILQLQSSGTDVMALSNAGQLSINTTSTTGAALSVNTPSGFTGDLLDLRMNNTSLLQVYFEDDLYDNTFISAPNSHLTLYSGLGNGMTLYADSAELNIIATQTNITNGLVVSGSASFAGQLTIGASDTTGTLLVLDTKTDSGDPAGTNGAMYYNADMGKFRCYEDGGWRDCIAEGSVGGDAIVNGGNAAGTDLVIGTTDENGISLVVNNEEVLNFNDNGDATFRPITDSESAFVIQSAGGEDILRVDTTNAGKITLLGGNNGETAPWNTNTITLPHSFRYAQSTAANGFIYVIGGEGYGGRVFYARANTDGSVGNWAETNSLPLAISEGHSVITANGYIYVVGGFYTYNDDHRNVMYAKINMDGSLGPWYLSSQRLNTNHMDAVAFTARGYLYVAGGDTTVEYAKLNPDGSTSPWQYTSSMVGMSGNRNGHSMVVANGYAYALGGGRDNNNNDNVVQYAKINNDGTLGTWTVSTNSLPHSSNRGGTAAISNGFIYYIGGSGPGSSWHSDEVIYARINSDGTIGEWQESIYPLPAARSFHNTVVINGYAYVLGGWNGTSAQNTIYYARLGSVVQMGGNLDLVGLQGGSYDGSSYAQGSMGGSITAGNGTFIGSLLVQGSAQIAGDLGAATISALNLASTQSALFSSEVGSALTVKSDSGAVVVDIDARTNTNIASQASSSFEDGSTGNWIAKGTATVTSSTEQAKFGSRSLKITTSTSANAGAQYIMKFKPGATYTLSFWARTNSGSFSTVDVGYEFDGQYECLEDITLDTEWRRYECTFTVETYWNNNNDHIFIVDTSTTSHTFYIDGFAITEGEGPIYYAPQASALQVDSGNNTITLLSGSAGSGEIGSWQLSPNKLVDERHGGSAATANGYIYFTGGFWWSVQDTVMYAKANGDGTTSAWDTTTSMPVAARGHSLVAANGYLYTIGGSNSGDGSGNANLSSVYFAKINSDGTLGSWSSTASLSAARKDATVIASNGYIYIIGGRNSSGTALTTVEYAKINSDGTLDSWNTTSSLPAGVYGTKGTLYNGHIYVVTGNGSSGGTTKTYYTTIQSDGTLASWSTASNDYPVNTTTGAAAAHNGHLYFQDGNCCSDTFRFAKIQANGDIGPWQASSRQLKSGEGIDALLVVGNYLYAINGNEGLWQRVASARLGGLVQIGGDLDLIGLQQTSSQGAAQGGNLTANDGNFIGTLDVQQDANIHGLLTAGSVQVLGNMNVMGTLTIGAVDNVGTLLVLDTKTDAGDPTGVAGGMYFNSALGKFRCYDGTAWSDCGSGLLYANTSIPSGNTVANTSSETNFASSYTIPANDCQPGKVYRVTASGIYTTPSSAGELIIALKWGSTTLSSYDVSPPDGATNEYWSAQFMVTCITSGASGSVEANGHAMFLSDPTTPSVSAEGKTSAVTVNTTTNQTLQLSADWGTASSDRSVTLRQIVIESL